MRKLLTVLIVGVMAWGTVQSAKAGGVYNGTVDNSTTAYGYYALLSGGIFENGQTRTGKKVTGGTMFLTHDDGVAAATPGAASYIVNGYQNWYTDGWFAETAGVALTMRDTSGGIVYDNNGIETGTYPANFYGDASAPSTITPGLYCGEAMPNNEDLIYAGYFNIDQATEIKSITGYFAQTYFYPIDLAGPWKFDANIFSIDPSTNRPTVTGGFFGDVLNSDVTSGTFTVADTGEVRHYSAFSNNDDIIYSLTFTLDTPIVLEAGEYAFSHAANLVPLPAAVWAGLMLLGGMGGVRAIRPKRA